MLTHRDLRGVLASYRRMGWAGRINRQYVDEHQQWRVRPCCSAHANLQLHCLPKQLHSSAAHTCICMHADDLTHLVCPVSQMRCQHVDEHQQCRVGPHRLQARMFVRMHIHARTRLAAAATETCSPAALMQYPAPATLQACS